MSLSHEDQEHCRQVARWFYGSEPQDVNEQVAEVLAEMLHKVIDGSRMMDLVPRPTGGVPGAGWLVSQGVQIWWRTHANRDKVYSTVKQSVAWGYKSKYHMAELGL